MRPVFVAFCLFVLALPACGDRRPGTPPTTPPTALLPVGLRYDFEGVEAGLSLLRGEPRARSRLLGSAAFGYIKKRQRGLTGRSSGDAALVRSLVKFLRGRPSMVPLVARNVALARGLVSRSRAVVSEAVKWLPAEFRFSGTLYFTLGYDVGTAWGSDASLNLGHAKFLSHPEEITYYLIHELHHVGFLSFHPMPDLKKIRRHSDLLRLVKFATQMEGMGVFAPWALRKGRGHLKDPDYVVLGDTAKTAALVREYFAIYTKIASAREKPVTPQSMALLEPLSSGKRLWYIAGAHMAKVIHDDLGAPALRKLVKKGPDAFFRAYFASIGQQEVSLAPAKATGGEGFEVLLDENRIVLPRPITFTKGYRPVVTPESRAILKGVVTYVMRSSPAVRLEIRIHAALKASHGALGPMLLHRLSRKRADALRQVLAALGLPTARFKIKLYGDTMPLMPHNHPGAPRVNNRVELYLY